jgi:1,4-alpha-glucan branching enzyme
VHFEFFDPAASKVSIAGTFNGWNPEGTEMNRLSPGRWEKDLLLSPGDYEYRLVVDGRWIPDPNAPRTVPSSFGDLNSLLTVPALGA